MKPSNSLKTLLLVCLMLMAVPLSAKTEATPANTGGSITQSATKLATKTLDLIGDAAITASIYAQLALDKNLSNLNVNVSTDKGQVILQGVVNSEAEANAVIKLASSASGVKTVDATQLRVQKSNQPFTDLVITAKVKGTLAYQHLLDTRSIPADIHVETNNGAVYLSGTASSPLQIQNAIKLAKSISGVSRVKSFVEVETNQ